MSEGTQRILGLITNARFIDIGSYRQIVGGTLEGKTFYSEPIDGIDGDVIQTASGNYRFSRSIH
ncbi:hypothetical protein B9J07_27940 [Sinorhizobium sp. LM21]|uniref:hypothetical protein n=1 Tax=Sinorhizobium sp. LM21 TaxID=1449788 RepID=UPI0005D734D6|nr:hypothetical protein [Sinorhizobium sp. LM21]AJW30176.1 hypothetical protein pLM21S1_p56 [Sinorhizobium sp. LM21]OWZ90421.1 hypothetical protein B9J07_27940 [Sinorhizobium sp. LM21]